ncbi:hypothetical protein AS594_02640 [Streptomyces agglomeratus]|uniref:Uncharacterized protein n=2 Tax=Streptomyces agglomeratus TaxID=285458 RepID=A0A1E5P2F2_9ACTN|nr:hypothetical protein AS594_02640 [Streptomyces agglomeratus]
MRAPAAVEARLAATFTDSPSGMTTVPLTGEDPHRTAAALAVLRDTGESAADAHLAEHAGWWSDRVLTTHEGDAALRIQHLRTGVRAFPGQLPPGRVHTAATTAVRALFRRPQPLPEVEAVARMAEEVHRGDSGNAQLGQTAEQVRNLVKQHLDTRTQPCRATSTSDALSDYVAARTLSAQGYACTVSAKTGDVVRGEISRLAGSDEAWSVPESVLLLQVSIAAQSDKRQNSADIRAVRQRAQDALRDALAGDGPYYRNISASVTELSAASTTLASLPGRSSIDVADATVRAMQNIALLRGRIPDQPDQNSAIDGYLATVAQAQLTGASAALGDVRKPASKAPLREQVRFYLQASLRAGEPLGPQDVRSSAEAALKRTKDPLDRITVTTSATLALLRTDQPCAVLDHDLPQLKDALARATGRYAQGSDAVKAWMTLLWTTTTECEGFQKETALESQAFLEQLAGEKTASNPTARAVKAWSIAELSCSKNTKAEATRGVALDTFAADSDPGEGLGLGTYAALRAEETATVPCSEGLKEKLKG